MTLDKLSKYSNWGLFVLRLVAGLIFLTAGFGKVFGGGMAGFIGMLGGLGFPAAGFFAWVVGLVELIGGLFLVIGLYVRWSALPLGIVMIVSSIVQWSNALQNGGGFNAARLDLLLLAAMIAVLTVGGGKHCLDCVWRSKKSK